MDFSLLVVLWLVFMIAEKFLGKKKNLPPNQQPSNTTGNADFDIPTLANDPNFPGEDLKIFQDEIKPAEVREMGFTEIYRQCKAENNFERKVETKFENSSENKKSNLPLNLTADSAMNAIVLSEILGNPKALRRR